ncbi:MAG: hypothetical protein ABIG28_00615 [archaeon]
MVTREGLRELISHQVIKDLSLTGDVLRERCCEYSDYGALFDAETVRSLVALARAGGLCVFCAEGVSMERARLEQLCFVDPERVYGGRFISSS